MTKASKVNTKTKTNKGRRIAVAKPDILDDIISQLDPDEVPINFIVMAKILTIDGEEKFITGEELKMIMSDPEKFNVIEARVILDIQKIRQAICDRVEMIFKCAKAMDMPN